VGWILDLLLDRIFLPSVGNGEMVTCNLLVDMSVTVTTVDDILRWSRLFSYF